MKQSGSNHQPILVTSSQDNWLDRYRTAKKRWILTAMGVALAVTMVTYVATPQVRHSSAATSIPGDLNGDGRVDVFDLSIRLSIYGNSITPTPTPVSTPPDEPSGMPPRD